MKQERTLLRIRQANPGLLMTSRYTSLDSNYSPPDHEEDNGQDSDFRMQGNTMKACIQATAPYLATFLA